MAVIAQKCLVVSVVDFNEKRISERNNEEVEKTPVYEAVLLNSSRKPGGEIFSFLRCV